MGYQIVSYGWDGIDASQNVHEPDNRINDMQLCRYPYLANDSIPLLTNAQFINGCHRLISGPLPDEHFA